MQYDSLFLAESPLQVLNCIEAAHYNGSKETLLVLRLNGDEQNDNQLLEASKVYPWKRVLSVRVENTNLITKTFQTLKLLNSVFSQIKCSVKSVYIGEFRSYWMALIRARYFESEHWLVDDGDITLSVDENYFSRNIFWPFSESSPVSKLVKIINSKAYNSLCVNPINAFTSFSLNGCCNQVIVMNKFDFLKSLRKPRLAEQKIVNSSVYFFGSKYSEEGIIDFSEEAELFSRVENYFFSDYVDIYYIPHRGDSQKKLDYISSKTRMKVKRLGMPAELYFATHDDIPDTISAACSSVLNNLFKMFQFQSVVSFKLNLDDMDQKFSGDFKLTYMEYTRLGIEVVD